MKHKKFAILGLGVFGSTIATKLSDSECEVIAIDKDMTCVDRVAEYVTTAIQADFTDIEQLKGLGIEDVDLAVVATGSHLEESVMAIMNLKELGVKEIIAKAKNKKYQQVLMKVGADRVVRPEKEMGVRVARQMMSYNIIDLINIDAQYSVVEIKAPKEWQNKSLIDLNLRKTYGVNILGIRKEPNAPLSVSPDAHYVINSDDHLLVIVDMAMFDKLKNLD